MRSYLNVLFTAASYVETLEEGLLPIYDGSEFQEDYAPIHAATLTKWPHNHNIDLLGWWPACSPDLAPIEHLWHHLKQATCQVNPNEEDIQREEAQEEELIR